MDCSAQPADQHASGSQLEVQTTIPAARRQVHPFSLVFLDELMSSWTEFVGDLVMSKWIVIVLGLSVLLNTYLLKEIAISTANQTRRFRHRLSIERARTKAATSDKDESSENTSDNDQLTPAERAAGIILASTTGGSLSIERLDSPDRNQKDHLTHRQRWSSGLTKNRDWT
ncbi:hypothetical protein PCANC_02211 [Puccinia coronata f. sp. avenae]|uniref:Copper transporter n=2 Tax=Puccinia coronata f. sp. avenae TaxID=200324 RepID=A0A2N5RTS5_9BASI|nr:hypothetical protein PCASD_26006 [Puccinia coronata f. sp. avenae]PLW55907.1 hypothetical protein PCANC_02211 [Puccinia coronata f. sp. avenae]